VVNRQLLGRVKQVNYREQSEGTKAGWQVITKHIAIRAFISNNASWEPNVLDLSSREAVTLFIFSAGSRSLNEFVLLCLSAHPI